MAHTWYSPFLGRKSASESLLQCDASGSSMRTACIYGHAASPQVQTPDGRPMAVRIPDGLFAGHSFQFNVPLSAPPPVAVAAAPTDTLPLPGHLRDGDGACAL